MSISNTPARYQVLPDANLQPTRPVPDVPVTTQAESMRELRAMHNEIPSGIISRDRQMQAWALSNSLSRHDMAIAVGMHKSRVDQIIRDLTLLDNARKAREALERLRRHMPESVLNELLAQHPELSDQYLFGDDTGEAVSS
jgi:hypothetical protein